MGRFPSISGPSVSNLRCFLFQMLILERNKRDTKSFFGSVHAQQAKDLLHFFPSAVSTFCRFFFYCFSLFHHTYEYVRIEIYLCPTGSNAFFRTPTLSSAWMYNPVKPSIPVCPDPPEGFSCLLLCLLLLPAWCRLQI